MPIPFYLLCGLLLDVGYHDVFISCLDSNSDGTVHCKVSIGEHVKQCYLSPSVLFKKETHLHIGWPAVNFQQMFIFG